MSVFTFYITSIQLTKCVQ